MEFPWFLGGEDCSNEGAKRERRVRDSRLAIVEVGGAGPERGQLGRRGRCGVIQFKQIFSNNKRKVLYEVNGKVKFEGD